MSGSIRRWLRIVAAAVLCAVPLAGSAEAQSLIRYCFNDWPPYTHVSEGTPTGISVRILDEASRRAGYVAEFRELPWKRCLQWVLEGKQDAVIDAAGREAYLQGPTSFSVYTNTFWQRPDGVMNAPDTAQLAGESLGLVLGYEYGSRLEREIAEAGVIVDHAADDQNNAHKLAYGRLDAIIGDFVNTRIHAANDGLDLVPVLPHHSFDLLYPSFNPSLIEMQRRVDAALAEMLRDGSIDEIYRSEIDVTFSDVMPDVGS